MAEQVLIQFRVDKNLKQDVADICDALGTDIPTVFRMCMKQIIISRGIPFATSLPENVVTRAEALDAFEEMRKQAADVPEMSLEEINEEIRSARAERKSRKAVNE
jgi:DNA-damage-inducible protein J